MAAGVLSRPGSKHGPCSEACAHVDCAATRSLAAAACLHCGRPIGFGVRFYDERTDAQSRERSMDGFAHAECVEDLIDRARRAS